MNTTNISRSKETLKSIGERLKKARESRNLTIEQAHIKTRIHLNVLKALEEGRIDEVLSVPYAKGFLKKYAVFLGLNGDEILNEYLLLHGEAKTAPPIQRPVAAQEASIEPLARVFSYAILFVIALTIIFASASYLKNRRDRIRQPKARVAAVKKALPAKMPKAQPRKVPLKTAVKEPAQQPPAITIPKNEPIIVTLKVKRNVMVQAARDGNVLFRNTLREGAQEIVKGKEKVNLAIAKIESLDIIVNGRPLSIQRKGSINDLEISRSGVRIK